ncbi:hypothetical protein HMPREF1032_03176 [Subdoligranulum sp. 4_3_54A2FAA]|nr:hypothetical protein HMPREF1032_03176 [Subdoligranulum sp. 4_3_54A2FAA]
MDDLISRKALLEDINAAAGNDFMGTMVAGTLSRFVKKQPAVDAALVVHGRWIFNQEQWTWDCTNCKGWVGSGVRISRYEYCPNCGAKMDGGNDNA